ncbi:MAG: FG-GAP repeat protein [Planctomycetota bacterium]|jgi:hypothetical protein
MPTPLRNLCFAGLGLSCALAGVAVAGQSIPGTPILAADASAGDRFGGSIAISGPTLIVGAHEDDDNGSNSGSAYLYRLQQGEWVPEGKITPDNGGAGDQFGVAVGLSGDVAVVGAWLDDDLGSDSGSAYVFRRQGAEWVQEAHLTPPVPGSQSGLLFGGAVAISGSRVVVGTMGDAQNGSYSGAVHVFRDAGDGNWVHEAKLVAEDGAALDYLGASVAIDGSRVIAGATGADEPAAQSGSVYVFRHTGVSWVQETQLLPSDPGFEEHFGESVGLSGNTAIVGAPDDGQAGADAGAAYVFQRADSEWIQQVKLVAPDAESMDSFGASVGIAGTTVIVGAPRHDGPFPDTGKAYLFEGQGATWNEAGTLAAPAPFYQDSFAQAVAVGNGITVAGATSDDDAGNNAGAAFAFEISGGGAPCTGDVNGNGSVGFDDILDVIAAWGPCSACPADVDLDGMVGFSDILALIAAWGTCP